MIQHILHYYNDGFFLSWRLSLPFRLNKGDIIADGLLDNSMSLEKETAKWITFCLDHEFFEVEQIQIDHNGCIKAFLRLPKDF